MEGEKTKDVKVKGNVKVDGKEDEESERKKMNGDRKGCVEERREGQNVGCLREEEREEVG